MADEWNRDKAEKAYEQQFARIKAKMRPEDYTGGTGFWEKLKEPSYEPDPRLWFLEDEHPPQPGGFLGRITGWLFFWLRRKK